jgi:hypothetical protein
MMARRQQSRLDIVTRLPGELYDFPPRRKTRMAPAILRWIHVPLVIPSTNVFTSAARSTPQRHLRFDSAAALNIIRAS